MLKRTKQRYNNNNNNTKMPTIVAIFTPRPIIMTRRTQHNHEDSNNKNNRVTKTTTTMIVMKIVTTIVGIKFIFINQVLITIRTSLVVRIKQNAISDTVLNIQSLWRHCFQSTSPIVFSP